MSKIDFEKENKRLHKKYKELLKTFRAAISVLSRHNDEEIDLRCAAEKELEDLKSRLYSPAPSDAAK